MKSFATPCPCSKCKREKNQEFIYIPIGNWMCPVSREVVVQNETQKDRAKRDLTK